ncbi:hypothetical protein TUM20985_46660 [Mycobacterium antarcticum]|nr:hypothetical protein TUM20985_46660 [Mycolicibacterium sp. TUM20985]
MLSFLTDVPGTNELRSIVRKVDTARHHGVPSGCVLELDLQAVPQETGGFDPLAMLTGNGKPLLLRGSGGRHPSRGQGRSHRRADRPRPGRRRLTGPGTGAS